MIEADFQRQYQIDLSAPDIEETLSSQRFFNLVYGLGADSIFLMVLAQTKKTTPHVPQDLTREQIIAQFRKT